MRWSGRASTPDLRLEKRHLQYLHSRLWKVEAPVNMGRPPGQAPAACRQPSRNEGTSFADVVLAQGRGTCGIICSSASCCNHGSRGTLMASPLEQIDTSLIEELMGLKRDVEALRGRLALMTAEV